MMPKNVLLQKKTATSLNLPGEGVGGIDARVMQDADVAGDPRVEEPISHPFAEKGTEPKDAALEPVEEEIQEHEFFKEGDESTSAFENALKALEELAVATDNDDIRECCRMTAEDLKYFHENGMSKREATRQFHTDLKAALGQDKEAATKSFGTVPPLGPNNPAPAPATPKIETPASQPPTPNNTKAQEGEAMSKEQAEALNALQGVTSSKKTAGLPCPICGENTPDAVKHIRTMHPEEPSGVKPDYLRTKSTGNGSPAAGKAPFGGAVVKGQPSVFPDGLNFPNNPRYTGHYDPPLEESREWREVADFLSKGKLPVGDQLKVYLSPQTIAFGNGKPGRLVIAAFGNHLVSALKNVGWDDFKIGVRSPAIVVSHLPLNEKPQVYTIGSAPDKAKMSSGEVPEESLGEIMGETGREHLEEKVIHLQQVGTEAIPTSVVDFELLRKFTGAPSFDIDREYDEADEKVSKHGYVLEIILSEDDKFGFQASKEATVEMHKTPPVGAPREDQRRHIDQSVQQEIKDGVDKPVQHRIGAEDKVAIEVEEPATAVCPNCSSSNHAVVDEENGEKLIECSDCGSFFTL